jgi:hypothetical protein
MAERWLPVVGHPGCEVSDQGRVSSQRAAAVLRYRARRTIPSDPTRCSSVTSRAPAGQSHRLEVLDL